MNRTKKWPLPYAALESAFSLRQLTLTINLISFQLVPLTTVQLEDGARDERTYHVVIPMGQSA